MKLFKKLNNESAEIIKNKGIGIIPTDTIYGIVGSTKNKQTIEKIYWIRKRDKTKPMIILIGKLDDLKLFNIKIDHKTRKILTTIWPGKISIILPCPDKKFTFLHKGYKTLAFRLPAKKDLRDWLKKTGPVVAPSANIAGMEPAKNIKEAEKYFAQQVNFYINKGVLNSKPSRVIEVKAGKIVIKRK